jgi:DNA-binding response OmpR family regulator
MGQAGPPPSLVGGRVLLVSGDPETIDVVTKATAERGPLAVVSNVSQALGALGASEFSAIVADLQVGTGAVAGLEALSAASRAPLLLLASTSEASTCIAALQRGASEYVFKPAGVRELQVRLRSAELRSPWPYRRDPLTLGDLSLHPADRSVVLEDRRIALTPREFDILYALAERIDKVVSKEELFEEVWASKHYGDLNVVEQHVSSLRHKLAEVNASSRLETLRHAGYRLTSGLSTGGENVEADTS